MRSGLKILWLSFVFIAFCIGSAAGGQTAALNSINSVFALLATQNIPLIINEFMASNSSDSGITDAQDQFDDWIEIYNFSDTAIDMGGMYLTDDLTNPTKWQIPASITIPAESYLLIWADNDTGDDELHANFKLNADSEEIGLFDIDGITMIDNVIFEEQVTNVSYGRYPDGADSWQYMSLSSPNNPNIAGYPDIAANVMFSSFSGLYESPFYVTLDTETEGAEIYYTLDGTEPYRIGPRGLITGKVYTEPVLIDKTRSLRAKAVKAGWLPSGIETRGYIFINPDIQDFSSNLPIAVIDTFGEGINETSQTPTATVFIDTLTETRARMFDPPDFAGRAGINIRGKSSEDFAKKQYHFETWDEYETDKDISILGFPAESDWILQGPYSDKSLMRNFLTYKWSNDLGRYAVRTKFIEMFLNTTGGSVSMDDYVGVYVFMEKIKRDNNRVNITELQPSDNAEPQITGGYIIKKDKLDTNEPTFTTSSGLKLIYVEPNGMDITRPQRNWIRNYINEFESALYGSNFADPINGYAKYIDVDSFIDHHILVELTKNIDGFRLSTYMFKDRGGKLNMGPVWDYNLSLGNADYYDGWRPYGWYYSLLNSSQYPWWPRLFEAPEFRLRYVDRWFELRENIFATDRLLKDVDDTAALLNEAQARNFDRWRILSVNIWPNWFVADTYYEEINWMRGWLEDRLAWMDRQIAIEYAATLPALNQNGSYVEKQFSRTMSTPLETTYYTPDDLDLHIP